MIIFFVVFLSAAILLAVVTGVDIKNKEGEYDRLAYYDQYWGFYDTYGNSEKALASVEPELRSVAQSIMADVGRIKTWELRAFEGRRTLVRQRQLYYKGTGTRLPYKHAFGFAIDLVPYDLSKSSWNFPAMTYFQQAVEKAIKRHLNITWGGTFQRVDMYHFELKTQPALYASVKTTLASEGLA